jgi:hypothetical protein
MAEDWTPKDNWSPNNHNHDDRYYTETEVNTLVTNLLKYPDYANGTKLPEKTTEYTATQDGWIFAYGRRDATYWHVRINGIWVWATGGSSWDAGTCLLPIKSGDVVAIYKDIGHDTDDLTKFDLYDGATLKFYPNR